MAEARVASLFMGSSPPAQLQDVAALLRTVAGPAGVSALSAALPAACRAHDLANAAVLALPAGAPAATLVVCAEGAAPDGRRCASSATRTYFEVDHVAGTVAAAPDADAEADGAALAALFPPALEPFHSALLAAAQRHVAACYHPHSIGAASGARGAEVFCLAGEGGAAPRGFVVVTSGVAKNLKNFWSGALRTRMVVSFPGGHDLVALGPGALAELSGAVRLRSHYFENGNVQMFATREMAPRRLELAGAAAAEPEAFAVSVLRAVAAVESAVLAGLDDCYDALGGAALKEVRRVLPVSGTRFNWAAGSQSRMVRSQLSSKQHQQHEGAAGQ